MAAMGGTPQQELSRDGERRVRLDPIRLPSPTDSRDLVSSGDGSIELQMRTLPWGLVCTLFLIVIAFEIAAGVGLRNPALVTVGWVVATSVAFALLLVYADDGLYLTRLWRFGPAGVTRQMRLPLPAAIWPRRFADVTECEIVHTLFTVGLFSRRATAGHQDTVRFRTRGTSGPITVMTRADGDSGARLWGDAFRQDRASEIEREILPDVLAVAGALSHRVEVPLYVSEKTFWIVSDSSE